jgi:hypothetical protein
MGIKHAKIENGFSAKTPEIIAAIFFAIFKRNIVKYKLYTLT